MDSLATKAAIVCNQTTPLVAALLLILIASSTACVATYRVDHLEYKQARRYQNQTADERPIAVSAINDSGQEVYVVARRVRPRGSIAADGTVAVTGHDSRASLALAGLGFAGGGAGVLAVSLLTQDLVSGVVGALVGGGLLAISAPLFILAIAAEGLETTEPNLMPQLVERRAQDPTGWLWQWRF